MAVYQTPSSRFFDCLRKAGLLVLLVMLLKGFTFNTSVSRQAMADTKGLRSPYWSATSTADIQTQQEQNQHGDDDDGDDAIIDTGVVLVDGDDDDQVLEQDAEAPTLSLHLIGERHSGTKWMSAHLQKCFPKVRFSKYNTIT